VLQQVGLGLVSVAGKALIGVPTNPFASVHNGQLKLKHPNALEILESTKELRRVFESSLPKARFEHPLHFVDGLSQFTDELRFSGKKLLKKLAAHCFDSSRNQSGHLFNEA
jgi:hypothetical protein